MAVAAHERTDRAIELFHALSDETRLEIIELLRKGERCVCELTDTLDAAQSRLSFHLRVLKDAGIVRDRKDGRWVHYELAPEVNDSGVFQNAEMERQPRLRGIES